MIRLILVAIFLIIFFILSIPVFFIEFIIGKFNMKRKLLSSTRIVQGAFRLVLFVSGVKVTVKGRENLPSPDEAVLYVGNHRGFFDIVVSHVCFPGVTGFVAKKEIDKVPFLRVWMRNIGCLFLDRKNIKEGLKTILQGIESIKNGTSLVIFPEGTRSTTNQLLDFKEGSLKLAEKSGCNIIPMAINNTSAVFEDHFPAIKSAHVIIEFGKPVVLKELDKEDRKFLGAHLQKIIQEMVDRNAAEV